MKLKKRKQAFTLIEVALSFSILSIIILFLFSTFRSSIVLSSKVEHVRHLIFSRYHIHERLSQMFFKIDSCINPLLELGESAFYTKETRETTSPSSLYFTFDNGIDPEEEFSGMVCAHLFLENTTLFLEMWPMKEKNSSKRRCEELFKKIDSLSFIFYKRPSLLSSSKDIELCKIWPIEYSDIPYCMTLFLKLQDETSIDYSFYLSSKIQPIHYEL
jgi:hypothetical protein